VLWPARPAAGHPAKYLLVQLPVQTGWRRRHPRRRVGVDDGLVDSAENRLLNKGQFYHNPVMLCVYGSENFVFTLKEGISKCGFSSVPGNASASCRNC